MRRARPSPPEQRFWNAEIKELSDKIGLWPERSSMKHESRVDTHSWYLVRSLFPNVGTQFSLHQATKAQVDGQSTERVVLPKRVPKIPPSATP